MTDSLPYPVFVGGLGGSGTGLVAQVLQRLGFYLGDSPNAHSDNIRFNHLVIHPDRYRKEVASGDFSKTLKALTVFVDTMVEEFQSTDAIAWGWKEPNSHIFLKQISTVLKGAYYIHVLRNGLDMAFSRNRRQLATWGWLFGINRSDSIENDALEFWVKANRRAIDLGNRFFDSRFYIVSYEELCLQPHDAIDALINFLGIDATDEKRIEAYALPKRNSTIGRHKRQNTGILDLNLVDEAQKIIGDTAVV